MDIYIFVYIQMDIYIFVYIFTLEETADIFP